jgi:HD-GYP domain-containing protein (c-di-GMP phosphodiesterase class II)
MIAVVVVLAVAAVVALVLWRREVNRRAGAQAAAARADGERREAEAQRDEAQRMRARIQRALLAEREWTRELRAQLARLSRTAFQDTKDTPTMVLQVALNVLDARKGLLLTRKDGDGDGRLDLVAHVGFAHDPSDSSIAQHYAQRVIDRDTTVREDDPRVRHGEARTAADDEIENLVAIPIYLHDDFNGVVIAANRGDGFKDYDDDVLLALGDHAGAVLHNSSLRGELRSSYLGTVTMLADAIATKDPFVGGHSEEVSTYVSAVAEKLGVEASEELIFGSLLHDLGKIGISERILLKPAALTPEERAVVELHPRIGSRLVSRIPALARLAPAILHHHERWDGTGYPGRLKGEQIPLEARIISVADTFSAMTADRPYQARRTLEEACAEIERCAGSQFDPKVAALFVEEIRRNPPGAELAGRLAAALDDPELEVHRQNGEPLLGGGSLAILDNVTLLYSHRYLHEVAQAAAEEATVRDKTFAVVVAELRGLPRINATEGYAAGDALIRHAARALQGAAVQVGGTACRYGGSRLALLVPGCDAHRARDLVAEALLDLPEEAGALITASGWQEGDSGTEVVDRARAALRGTPA